MYIAVVAVSFLFFFEALRVDVRSRGWILQLKTSKILYMLQDHAFAVARRCAFTARACGPADDAACLSSTMPPCSFPLFRPHFYDVSLPVNLLQQNGFFLLQQRHHNQPNKNLNKSLKKGCKPFYLIPKLLNLKCFVRGLRNGTVLLVLRTNL